MDHTTCMLIIGALASVVVGVAGWGYKNSIAYQKQLQLRADRAEAQIARLEGKHETKDEEGA